MVEQIKYVYWFNQRAIFEHDQFFDDVGHRAKRGKQHEYGRNDKNGMWYLIQKTQHSYSVVYNVSFAANPDPITSLRFKQRGVAWATLTLHFQVHIVDKSVMSCFF